MSADDRQSSRRSNDHSFLILCPPLFPIATRIFPFPLYQHCIVPLFRLAASEPEFYFVYSAIFRSAPHVFHDITILPPSNVRPELQHQRPVSDLGVVPIPVKEHTLHEQSNGEAGQEEGSPRPGRAAQPLLR